MPKVILYIATSEDGFIADKNGGVEWLPSPSDEAEDFGYKAFYSSIDCLVMGSATYEQCLIFGPWPYPDKTTFVYTKRSLKKPEQMADLLVEFISLDIDDFMRLLDKRGFKSLWLVGGNKLIEPFYQRGLIDEYIITIIPKVLGEGISLPKQILDRNGLIQNDCKDLGFNIKQNFLIKKN